MRRRAFLLLIPGIVAAACMPKLAYKDGKASVQWYLTQLYNRYSRSMKHRPNLIEVSPWLRDKFESELIAVQRFVPDTETWQWTPTQPPNLYFKSCVLKANPRLRGWDVRIS